MAGCEVSSGRRLVRERKYSRAWGLTKFLSGILLRSPMWTIETTSQWERDLKHYEKKHPRELAAVLSNLNRYHDLLNVAKNARTLQAGFLHPEPLGIIALDQKGGGVGLQETRFYTFAQEERQTLWIITLGNKNSQPSDIRIAKEFVAFLLSEATTPPGSPSD